MKLILLTALLLAASSAISFADERQESFDRDPGWDGYNHRATNPPPRDVRQDFGYSRTRHCGGGEPGELGGLLTPAAETAYYAKPIPVATFNDRLGVSGKLACTGRQFHVLVGFFNRDTVNEWRTPNTIVLRLYGRGDVFYAYLEYCTSRWRAGGDSPGGFATIDDPEKPGKKQLRGFKSQGAVHTWSLEYDPHGNDGRGVILATIDGERAVCILDEGHKADGAHFNRCGLLNIPKSYDSGGEIWLDDLTINSQTEDFAHDPGWEAVGNRRTYVTNSVRPRFDFGFSDTQLAGGKKRGELGGIVFRGDSRYADRLAYYGDRLQTLTLAKPLRASGKVALRRGVSDSTSLIGFFHSHRSIEVTPSQSSGWPMNFLGVAIEGPSREGFLFYPAYRFANGKEWNARGVDLPHILPNGESHNWSLELDPAADGGHGKITVVFDEHEVELPLPEGHRDSPAVFDRFGIVTTWIDGNAQHVYFDDLTYTWRQE
jgi:hypothetical protein